MIIVDGYYSQSMNLSTCNCVLVYIGMCHWFIDQRI